MSYHTGANQICQQKFELLFEYTKMHVKRMFHNIFFTLCMKMSDCSENLDHPQSHHYKKIKSVMKQKTVKFLLNYTVYPAFR